MWTAVVRELKLKYPNQKIVLKESEPSLWNRLLGKRDDTTIDSEIFKNNPYLTRPEDIKEGDDVLFVYLGSPKNSYHAKANRKRVVFKNGGHVIEIVCKNYGIYNPKKKCELYLTEGERKKADKLSAPLGKFIAIEPHTKAGFTLNKGWPFEKWQEVVNALHREYTIVQVSFGEKSVLQGVVDLTGKLNFREASALIGKSLLFLTTEGGLMHAANAVGTRAVVVYSGYLPLVVTAYNENVNLYPDIKCAPCGLRVKCPINLKCMQMISSDMVIAATHQILSGEPDSNEQVAAANREL